VAQMPQLSHLSVKEISYSFSPPTSLRIAIAAFEGLKAFSKRREQRSSQMRHPVHFAKSTLIGGPFLRVTKMHLLLISRLAMGHNLVFSPRQGRPHISRSSPMGSFPKSVLSICFRSSATVKSNSAWSRTSLCRSTPGAISSLF